MEVDLAGKNILVTGGTSTLGSAIVSRALEEKAAVYFTYFENEERASELAGRGAAAFRADLRDPKEPAALKAKLKEKTACLDGLVLNVGIARDHTLGNLTEEEFDEVLQVNLTADFLLVKAFLPLLYKSGSAKILGVTSRVGMRGGFGEANYAAAKAGLAALMKTAARETGRRKICVNAVAPGFMISGMTKNLSEEVYERQRKDSCLGVFTDPAEVADFIIYLLSDRVRGVSGQLFHFDSRSTNLF